MGGAVSYGGVGLLICGLLTATLLLLKVFGAISVSWWLVSLPIAIGAGVMAVAVAGVFTVFVRLDE